MDEEPKESVCVVGSGVTGLVASLLLARDGRYQVTLLEKEAQLGGHALTVLPDCPGAVPVDLGFQVYNKLNYPLLCRLFDELNIETEDSDMSFSSSTSKSEWASHGLNSLFSTRSNLLSPKFWKMVMEMFRFGREAKAHLPMLSSELTLGEYLKINHYADSFAQDYLLPMTAAVWSVPEGQMMSHPAKSLISFWDNHHLLNPIDPKRPVWRVVKNRSKTYVEGVEKELINWKTCDIQKSVTNVRLTGRTESSATVEFTTSAGVTTSSTFRHVVFCTHSDQTLGLLGEFATEEERQLLSAVHYEMNKVVLHSDASYMPRSKLAWASWNVTSTTSMSQKICVTYWLNRLQHLKTDKTFLVTLNPPKRPTDVHLELDLAHPILTVKAVASQKKIRALQSSASGKRSVWFAGAWMGSGFHEDGAKSALEAIQALTQRPTAWAVAPEPESVPYTVSKTGYFIHKAAMAIFHRICERSIKLKSLLLVLPDGTTMGPYGSGGEAERVTLRIRDMSFFWKVVAHSDIGLGEAYMDEQFTCDNLIGLLDLLIENRNYFVDTLSSSASASLWIGGKLYALGNRINLKLHEFRANTQEMSRKNISEHYDLGNYFYKLFLDETMTYSAGVHLRNNAATLRDAQLAKYDLIISKFPKWDGGQQQRVLEIGCGWGGFASRVLETRPEVKITCVTISEEQFAYCQEKFRGNDRVELHFCDYRNIFERYPAEFFDAIVSIEMLEAVGHENLPEYFRVVSSNLKSGGKAIIQVICGPNERYEEYLSSSDFIRKHIFPGGSLPCLDALTEAKGDSLTLDHIEDIGLDYAETLLEWRKRFELHRPTLSSMGFNKVFFRKWVFYFVYCEIAFRKAYIHDFQLVFEKKQDEMAITARKKKKGSFVTAWMVYAAALVAVFALVVSYFVMTRE